MLGRQRVVYTDHGHLQLLAPGLQVDLVRLGRVGDEAASVHVQDEVGRPGGGGGRPGAREEQAVEEGRRVWGLGVVQVLHALSQLAAEHAHLDGVLGGGGLGRANRHELAGFGVGQEKGFGEADSFQLVQGYVGRDHV